MHDLPAPEDQARIAAQAGYQGLVLDDFGTRKVPLDLDALIEACNTSALEIPVVYDGSGLRFPLTHPDASVRQKAQEGIGKAITMAQRCGASQVVVVPGVVNNSIPYDAAFHYSQEGLLRCAEVASSAGVALSLLLPQPSFLLSPVECAYFLERLPVSNVGVCLDLAVASLHGWAEQWIAILAKRLLALDLRDFSKDRRDREGMSRGFQVSLGEGDCDWPAIAKALRETQFTGWCFPQAVGGPTTALSALAVQCRKLLSS